MKTATYIALSSILVMGCTMEVESDVGTVSQASTNLCHNPEGYYGIMASVAAALARELGEWEATTHLQNGGFRNIQLTQAAIDQCLQRGYGECDNTQNILDLQLTDYMENPDGVRIWNAEAYYWQQLTYLERQKMWEDRHPGSDSCGPRSHLLEVSDVQSGTCALDFTFDVTMFDGGQPSDLECKLKFAGWPENLWLDFRSTDTTVTIDPMIGSMDSTLVPPSQCHAGYFAYDPSGLLNGTPCCPDGFDGTLEVSSWSDSMLVCTWD